MSRNTYTGGPAPFGLNLTTYLSVLKPDRKNLLVGTYKPSIIFNRFLTGKSLKIPNSSTELGALLSTIEKLKNTDKFKDVPNYMWSSLYKIFTKCHDKYINDGTDLNSKIYSLQSITTEKNVFTLRPFRAEYDDCQNNKRKLTLIQIENFLPYFFNNSQRSQFVHTLLLEIVRSFFYIHTSMEAKTVKQIIESISEKPKIFYIHRSDGNQSWKVNIPYSDQLSKIYPNNNSQYKNFFYIDEDNWIDIEGTARQTALIQIIKSNQR